MAHCLYHLLDCSKTFNLCHIWQVYCIAYLYALGPFNKYLRGQDEGVGGQKMSVFVQAQGIKTVHAGGVQVDIYHIYITSTETNHTSAESP